MVEDGGEPMCVFRDSADANDMLYMVTDPSEFETRDGQVVSAETVQDRAVGSYRAQYHRGFVVDDADRYGPAVDLIKELHQRIEEARTATG